MFEFDQSYPRQLARDHRSEGAQCLGWAGGDSSESRTSHGAPVRSLTTDRVLWTRGEVLALRRRDTPT